MTQQSTNKSYFTFVKGIITEAGPLTFPENAALDMENVVLNRDGSLQRRLGMDFEDDSVLNSVTVLPDDAVACFLWENAGNDVNNQFAVVQIGTKVYVFDSSEVSISASMVAALDFVGVFTGKTVLGAASGMGALFLDEASANPVYLSYNPSSGAVTATQYGMNIRDTFGVNDGLAVSDQPSSLSDEHNYNLRNQGWGTTQMNAYHADTGSVWPANSQQWFVGKDTNDDFSAPLLKKQDFGTTPAPRGRYLIDAFNRKATRDSVSGITTPADTETGRPSAVAFAFERLFHAGIKSSVTEPSATRPNMTGFVFYSRTLRDMRDVSQYHTDADPTSEFDSELVDTDGGFVNIPNSGPIYKLIQKDDAIVIFAENGVWALQGDEGGFRATANKVVKISSNGALNGTAIVDVEDSILYWNEGGIYVLGVDENTGMLRSKSISEDTIQTLFQSITKEAKINVVGAFDPVNRRVMWMYNDEASGYDGTNFRNKYNKELVLDLVLSAFYKHNITSQDDPSPYIAGFIRTPDFLLRQEGVRSRGDTVTKYLTIQFIDPDTNSASFTFSYYRNARFRDWMSLDGEGNSFLSYLITGYEIMGDSARNKQAAYITTHFLFTETEATFTNPDDPFAPSDELYPVNPSACVMQAQWDWSDHPDSGKWGPEIEAYRLLRQWTASSEGPVTYGQRVITNKHRVSGSGKSLSLYFRSEDDKDFQLQGWTTRFTGQANV